MIRWKPTISFLILWSIVLGVFAGSIAHSRDDQFNIGVIGDGFVLGTAASEDFALDPYLLWTQNPHSHNSESLSPNVKRLWPLASEFMSTWEWIWDHLQQSAMMKFVDREDVAFSTLVAHELMQSSANSSKIGAIYVAGEQYASSLGASALAKRVVSQAGPSGLDYLLVSFSGFELCMNLSEGESTAATYLLNIEKMLNELEVASRERHAPTKVMLFAPVPIMDILAGDLVALKQVPFYGNQQTCRDIRSKKFVPTSQERLTVNQKLEDPLFQTFSRIMPQSLALVCPAFATNDLDKNETQSRIANTLRSFREGLAQLATKWSEKAKDKSTKLELQFIDSLALVKLLDTDVSNDCMHLSTVGHKKVADLIVASLSLK